METAALYIAKSALNSAIKASTIAFNKEVGLLLGVRKDLSFIKEELEMMQAFLCAASAQNAKSETVTVWVKQVQDLAFEVEDCLQYASLKLKKKGWLTPVFFSLKARHHIAREIQVLKIRIEDVSQRNKRYSLIRCSSDQNQTISIKYKENTLARLTANRESLFVLKTRKDDIMKLISNESFRVISVVGMGGLGKSTVVREVYGSQELSSKFECFAWVTVLHPFNMEELTRSLFRQLPLVVPGEAEPIRRTIDSTKLKITKRTITKTREYKMEEMETKINEHLKSKKCVVVLDDLSSEAEWEAIKPLLSNEPKGCCIIVTTRSESLAKYISQSNYIYMMKPLSKDESLELFYKTVFQTTSNPLETDGRENKDGGSPERDTSGLSVTRGETTENHITDVMREQASLIIDKCGGLPLPIVTIGRCLASRDTTSAAWQAMNDHLTSEINLNPHLGQVKAVLTSSYDGLPHHLKFYFLYLAVFYKHKEIRRSRIIRRWLAEGLIGRRDMTAEEVGEEYFYELMSRSLIQPSKDTLVLNGTVTKCSIHNLIYELIVVMSQDENVVSLLEDQNNVSMNEKVRHLVIAGRQPAENYVIENLGWSHMRSLTIFGVVDTYLPHTYAKFLRVLDLEGTLNLKNIHLSRIGDHRFLRYLGLRGTTITKLPASLEKLHDLETLDIRNTVIAQLPKRIVKLHKLSYLRAGFDFYKSKSTYSRHTNISSWYDNAVALCLFPCLPLLVTSTCLEKSIPTTSDCINTFILFISPQIWLLALVYVCFREKIEGPLKSKNFGSFAVKAPCGIGKLRSLRNLGMVDIGRSKSIAKDMKNLTNLNKLGVTGLSKRNGKQFAEVIKELTQLRTLVLSSADDSGLSHCLESLKNFPSSLKYLRSLKLYSPVNNLPDWINKLENLVKMHLRNTELKMDNVNVIGNLPNLIILCVSKNSFSGEQLCFGRGAFPMLQALVIERMKGLISMSFEESSMPRLKKLEINRCHSLCQGGLLGLEHLVQIKEILLKYKYYEKDEKHVYNQNMQALENELNNKISSHANQPGLRVMRY